MSGRCLSCGAKAELAATFCTECGKINTLAMQLMTGHEGMGIRMAAEHYIDAEVLLAAVLPHLPQPGPVRQRELF